MRRASIIMLIGLIIISCGKNRDASDVLIKFYGDAYEDIGNCVAEVENGYVLTGQFTRVYRNTSGNFIDSSAKRMAVIRTSRDGKEIWKKYLGGELTASGSKVLITDESIVITGYVIDPVSVKKNIYIVKLDTEGNVIKEKIFNLSGNQYGTDIIETETGFLLMGNTDSRRDPLTEATGNAEGKKDILLLRLNINLEPVGSIPSIGFPGNDEGMAVKPDITGGYLVVGTTDRSDKHSSVQAGNNIIIFRLNSDGSTTQPRIVGGIKNETASDFEVLSDGYLIAGTTGNSANEQRGYVWKIPVNIYEEPVFEHEIEIESGSGTPFILNSMCRYKSSSFLLAGQYGTGLLARILIFSIDEYGNMVEGRKKITGGTGSQAANDVISDSEGNIIVVGKNSYENNSLITFLKFRF